MAVDPSILHKAQMSAINRDTACRNCGYNLVGLSPGSPCPECGTYIPTKKTGVKGDNLTDAPIQYLRQFAWAVLINALALPVTIIAVEYATLNRAATLIALVVTLGLVASVWFVTMQRGKSEQSINDYILDNPKWRLGIRLSVIAWPIFAASHLLLHAGPTGGWLIAVAITLGLLNMAASLSLVPLFIHHSAFASWAGDKGLDARFRGSVWVIVACTVFYLIRAIAMELPLGPIGAIFGVAGVVIAFFYVAAWVIAIIGVLQLAGVAFSAIGSNKAAAERDARIAARRAKEMAQTVEQQFAAPDPVNPYEDMIQTQHTPGPEPAPAQRIDAAIDAPDDLDAYDLAPVDKDPDNQSG